MNIKQEPQRVLCIIGSMDAGGAETFLMKVYRVLDKNKYQLDFCVFTHKKGFYDDEILSKGGRIFNAIPKTKNPIKSFIMIKNAVKKNKYNYVMRVSENSISTLDLIAARFGGAKILVFRSSNSGTGGGKVSQLLHRLFKCLAIIVPTVKIAPSLVAAEFMFGKNSVINGKVTIVNNAIAINDFIFNIEKREHIRKEFNIENKFVVGHVGRFNHQKNHLFIIDIFNEIVKQNPQSVLVLVGKGELEDDIKTKISSLGLTDKVIFTGVRSDIPTIMMAMDVFLFPSFFEGMPNTVIEAQATGLQCIISDNITKEANITGLVDYLSLDETSTKWAEKAMVYATDYERRNMEELFVYKGYDIVSESKKLIDLINGKNNYG